MKTDALKQRFLQQFGHLLVQTDQSARIHESIMEDISYRHLDAGTVLMAEGTVCQQLPFVLTGSIRVYKNAESGREITLYRIRAGESCILSSSCGSGKLQFPAVAVAEVPTAAAFIPAARVAYLMEHVPAFQRFVLEQWASRMADVIELVEEVAFRHVDQRLYEWLQEHIRVSDGSAVKVTHQELAGHIGSSREVVSRILKDWEDRQLLKLGRGSINVLPDFAKLAF